MNSGIQDADNIAWKLALVLHGQASEGLLETYHTERYAAAKENLAVTEATIRFMVPPSLLKRLTRNIVLHLANPVKSARRHVNSGRMSEPSVYNDSPIVDPTLGHSLIGHLAPDGWVLLGGRRKRIRTLFGKMFVALNFVASASAARRVINETLVLQPMLPIHSVIVLPTGTEIEGLHEQVTVIYDENPNLRTDYFAEGPTWMLVRPDGYVAASFNGEMDSASLRAALQRCARFVPSAEIIPLNLRTR